MLLDDLDFPDLIFDYNKKAQILVIGVDESKTESIAKIGIITAPTGAAIKDILSTIKRRFPACNTILFPSLVQGKDAAPDIVKNIKLADSYNLDTLIVGRGGGSIEDLWPFNEEIVARAIFECNTPIISAVGHEIDTTIVDFVADRRAGGISNLRCVRMPSMVQGVLSQGRNLRRGRR